MLLECFNALYQQSPRGLMNTLYNVGGTTVRTEPRISVSKPTTVKQLDRTEGTFQRYERICLLCFCLHFSRPAVKRCSHICILELGFRRAPM
jgi:hypothetical protein